MKDIVIIGAGGVGRETAWIIEEINKQNEEWNILGYIDDNKSIWGKDINNYKILGGIDYLLTLPKDVYVIIAIANYKVKKSIVEKLGNRFKFPNIIYPGVNIHSSSSIGEGCIIYPQVVTTTNISIGNHVIISPKCGIGHESVIKDYVSLLWNVNISGNDLIKEGVLIGSGATVIQNITVNEGAIIGAGAVVVKNIDCNTTSVGVPSKVIR